MMLSSWMNRTSSRKLPVTSAETTASVWMSATGPLRISTPLRGSTVRRAGWLRDEGAEKPVLPRREAVHVVVEVGSAELDVGIVAVAYEFRAYHLAGRVGVAQGLVADQRVVAHPQHSLDLEGPVLVHSHPHQDARLKACRAAHAHPGGARACWGRQGFPLSREGAYGLLVVETSGHAVAALDVELGEVDVDV